MFNKLTSQRRSSAPSHRPLPLPLPGPGDLPAAPQGRYTPHVWLGRPPLRHQVLSPHAQPRV